MHHVLWLWVRVRVNLGGSRRLHWGRDSSQSKQAATIRHQPPLTLEKSKDGRGKFTNSDPIPEMRKVQC